MTTYRVSRSASSNGCTSNDDDSSGDKPRPDEGGCASRQSAEKIFAPGLLHVDDGSLLFLMRLLSKCRPIELGGSRIGMPTATLGLHDMSGNGLRAARDREKKYLTGLIEKLTSAFDRDIVDTDQVAVAVHVSERLRTDSVVMAQVQNNSMEPAVKADLPSKAVAAIASHEQPHQHGHQAAERRGDAGCVPYGGV